MVNIFQKRPNNRELSESELRRRRTRKIISAAAGLVLLLFLNKLFLKGISSPVSTTDNALIIILFNINFILLIVLVLLVFRNLVKLLFERRKQIIGARFRTKLMLTFVGFSLVPSVLLFLFASGLITGAIDQWFNTKVEKSLDEALKLAHQVYREKEGDALKNAQRLSKIIAAKRMTDKENRVFLANTLAKERKELGLDGLYVYSTRLDVLARSFDEELPPEIFDDYDPFKLSEVLAGKEIVEIKSGKTGDVIRASYPIMTPNAAKEISGVAVVSYHLPLGTVDRMRSITAAFEEYKQLKILKNPIKVSYMITFLTITLLVIFAAIWFGFYLARGISVPIQELAQGTKAVAEGRLDYKIEFQSDDELGMLIESFNKMTGDLFKGSLQLEQANTDLLTSNQEIDRRRIHMETVLANINTGVISIDAMGFISMINKSAQSMLSFSDKDVSKSHYDEVFGQYNLYSLKLLADRVNEGYLKKVDEQVQLNINGSILTFIVNINPLTDEAGEYLGKVLVFDDLTELTKVQRVAAWREVARRIAHEIKNPLTPIQLSTQRLRKKHREKALDYEKIFDECTKIIIQEVDELKNLVDEFSNFARLPEAKPKLNNLHKILEEVVTLYQASNKDTRLYAEFGSRISHIKVDREQIKRAIINLIDNSIEAMGGKGEILVVTSLNDDLDVVRIAIKDQGPGISAQDKKRLFVPYFSTKKEGTGLGLAIVNRIVSDHKGYIRVSDNFPVGTVMTIELPVDSRAGNYRATG